MFKYITHCHISLTASEEELLSRVDGFSYSQLSPYGSLGALHATLIVEPRSRVNDRTRSVRYKKETVEKKINELERTLNNKSSAHTGNEQFLYLLLNYLKEILKEMDELGVDELMKEERMSVLGEYIRKDVDGSGPKVVLYMDTIRSIDSVRRSHWTLAEVYVHELHHAWYDHDSARPMNFIREVEEPLAELGMLLFMEQFDNVEAGILSAAVNSVRHKKLGMTSCYGFGSYLYDNKSMHSRDWRAALHGAKYILSSSAPCVNEYCSPFKDGFYPIDENESAGLLWRVLFEASAPLLLNPESAPDLTYLFRKKLGWSVFHFGFNVDNDRQTALWKAIGKTLTAGDKEDVRVMVGSDLFDCRLSFIKPKNHPKGVVRFTWKNGRIVENSMAVLFRDLYNYYLSHGAKSAPYGLDIDVNIYYLGGNRFAIV